MGSDILNLDTNTAILRVLEFFPELCNLLFQLLLFPLLCFCQFLDFSLVFLPKLVNLQPEATWLEAQALPMSAINFLQG